MSATCTSGMSYRIGLLGFSHLGRGQTDLSCRLCALSLAQAHDDCQLSALLARQYATYGPTPPGVLMFSTAVNMLRP